MPVRLSPLRSQGLRSLLPWKGWGLGSPSAAPEGFTERPGLGRTHPGAPYPSPRPQSLLLCPKFHHPCHPLRFILFYSNATLPPTFLVSPPCSPPLFNQDWLKGEARDWGCGLGGGGNEGKKYTGLLQNQEAKDFPGLPSTLRAFPTTRLPRASTPCVRPCPASPETTGQGALGSGSPGSQMLRSDPRCVEGPGW